jgi:hypothetical protein
MALSQHFRYCSELLNFFSGHYNMDVIAIEMVCQ